MRQHNSLTIEFLIISQDSYVTMMIVQYFSYLFIFITQDQCSESFASLLDPYIIQGIDVFEDSQSENSLVLGADFLDFEQLHFEGLLRSPSKTQNKACINKENRSKQPTYLIHIDNQLEMILGQNDEDSDLQNHFDFSYFHESQFESNFESEGTKAKSQQLVPDQNQQQESLLKENQNKLGFSNLPVQWLASNPKKMLVDRLEKIVTEKSREETIGQLRDIFDLYVFEHEKYYIEDSMRQLSGNSTEIVKNIIKGVINNFKKNIGGLPFEKRRVKLFKYMEKKRRRVWKKKVNYDCRKKVADKRLRNKGKFIKSDSQIKSKQSQETSSVPVLIKSKTCL